MIPGVKLGPMTILLLYLVAATGVMAGAHVGYHADSAANATIEYNDQTDVLTVGNETVDIYQDEESNVTFGAGTPEGEREPPEDGEFLSERGEAIFNGSDDRAEELDGQLEAATPDRLDDVGMVMTNSTVTFMFTTMADVGAFSASLTYQYQDAVEWQTVWLVTSTIVFAPLLAGLYLMIRQVRG